MKSLFKVTLLATAMTLTLNTSTVFAADATSPVVTNSAFKNNDQQSAYALGASLGRYMDNSLKEQEKLGIKLDKDQLIAGVQDAKENADKGAKYRDTFAKEKGVKKTASGLLYKVENAGTGDAPKDSDTVVVNYKGTLADGTEFDNSYKRGEPLSFRLDGVIPGWTEGLKQIKKGGKITLVIPPELAYGKAGVPGIPANSTLIFDVELLDVKAAAKADAQEQQPAVDTKAKK